MDDNGHREHGRHKAPQGQWSMQHQPSMKQIMGIMAERDAAVQEKNLAISEKKAAFAERDMAILERDSAIAERDNAIMQRDSAIATLQYRENSVNTGNMSPCSRGIKQIMHQQQQQQHVHHHHHHESLLYEAPYNSTTSVVVMEPAKPRRGRRPKEEAREVPSPKRAPKSTKKVKREGEDLDKMTTFQWKGSGGGDDLKSKPDWKDQDLGLNQVAFDDSTMPVPVCSCTGVFRPCYKWGNGGWQSSCCTTTMSVFPLPAVPNKRHARVGGRKMSGSAFNKLLSRLAAEGHDLSNPVDLKEHWAKHGTNRYITIK